MLTLVYGYDSKRGISIWDCSFGPDSRCVNAGKLAVVVLEPEGSGSLRHYLVDVDCEGE